MRQIQNALPVVLTLVIGLLVAISGGLGFKVGSAPVLDANLPSENIAELPNSDISNTASENPEPDTSEDIPSAPQESNVSSATQSSSDSVAASASGQALGKIVEQFISPYSAKVAYNNVYVKNNSGLNIDLKTELSANINIKIKKSSEPEVLIVHTHATEGYMYEDRDYYTASDAARTTDNSKNVTHIGDIIASKLEASGISVIHDTTQHDYPEYNGSYSRAEVTIKEYLAKYPSIKIVIDVHRDSIALNDTDRVRPVAEINGKNAAQVMLCMGSQSGAVSGFPNWKENFRLAARLQQTFEVMYPGLARPMVLASRLYNENLTTGSMLLEVGTESNLFSEAEYSAELVGNALVSLLNTLG